jgi:hypothetical protein
VSYLLGEEANDLEQLEQAETSPAAMSMPGAPVSSVRRTIRNYIFWNYQRGSIHYDIMVTLILLFIFVTPLFINFKDKPVEHSPHLTAVVVIPQVGGGVAYQVPAAAVSGEGDSAVRKELQRIIAPIAGQASISRYEKTSDAAGEPVYQVWVKK